MAHQLAFNEQQDSLERVQSRIQRLVLAYVRSPMHERFHMDDLRRYVDLVGQVADPRWTVAPDSAGRILRDLKQNGVVNYEVVNRKQSLYRVLPIETNEDPGQTAAGASR